MHIGDITGQLRLIDDIDSLLASEKQAVVRLRGPSGSGKTWVASAVVDRWRESGGVAFVGPGDELFTTRPHFPLLVAVSAEMGRARTKTATRLALEPVNAIPIGGKPL